MKDRRAEEKYGKEWEERLGEKRMLLRGQYEGGEGKKRVLLAFQRRKQTVVHSYHAWGQYEFISNLEAGLPQVNNILTQPVHHITTQIIYSNTMPLFLSLSVFFFFFNVNKVYIVKKLTISIHRLLLRASSQHGIVDPDYTTTIHTRTALLSPVNYR